MLCRCLPRTPLASNRRAGSDNNRKAGSASSRRAGSDNNRKAGLGSSHRAGSGSRHRAGSGSRRRVGLAQPPQGGFGQPPQGGFGQPPQGGFGQPPQGGFGQPPQGGFGQPPQGGFAQQPPTQQPQQGGMNPQFAQMLDQMAQYERQDFGVQPTQQLHSGAMHGPTPASIPGGQIITTKGLVELVQRQSPYVLFDVLGGQMMLPGSTPLVEAAQPGTFDDQVSQRMGQFLEQNLQGNKQIPLIFYCQSVQCWMSYNAALRAINLGYSNVLWYRGGIEAWQNIQGPMVPNRGG